MNQRLIAVIAGAAAGAGAWLASSAAGRRSEIEDLLSRHDPLDVVDRIERDSEVRRLRIELMHAQMEMRHAQRLMLDHLAACPGHVPSQ